MSNPAPKDASKAVDAIVESLLAGESDRLRASVVLPSAEQLEIRMVPLTLVQALDESRSHASSWTAGASLVTSVATGIAINWLTSDHPHLSVEASAVLAAFATLAVVTWTMAAFAARRAKGQRRLLTSLTEENG
jgi:hypothetical protein